MVRIALIQMACSADVGRNLEKAAQQVSTAAAGGARVILLQELFSGPYFCRRVDPDAFRMAESIPGPTTDRFGSLASRHEVVLVLPLFERAAAGLYYNSVAVIDADGSLLGRYRKMHIPEDPGFHEKYYFTPGDSGYKVFRTRHIALGTLICWDQWFPEAARITAMAGAELIVYPTAIATLPDEDESMRRRYLQAWETVQRSHAIANGCYVASVNRSGTEGDLRFWGRSFVSDPFGEIIARAGESGETLFADIDVAAIEPQRQSWPFFRDRRIESYGPLLSRWTGDESE